MDHLENLCHNDPRFELLQADFKAKIALVPEMVHNYTTHFAHSQHLLTMHEKFSACIEEMKTAFGLDISQLREEIATLRTSSNAPGSSPSSANTTIIPPSFSAPLSPKIIPPSRKASPPPHPSGVSSSPPPKDGGLGDAFNTSSVSSDPYQHEVTNLQNTVVFHSGGNLPVPKFSPTLDSPESFMKELELYMKRKRVMSSDWILMLPTVFEQDKQQKLWWQSTKLWWQSTKCSNIVYCFMIFLLVALANLYFPLIMR